MKTKFTQAAILSVLTIVGSSLTGCATSEKSTQASASGSKAYPLKTCLVTDEKLGGHGEAYAFTHNGQEIKLCCEGCKEDFDKDPNQYLKKLAGK